MKREIKKYLGTNKIETRTCLNLEDAAKAALRGKFVVIPAYIKENKCLRFKNPTVHLERLAQEPQTKPEVSRRDKIIHVAGSLTESTLPLQGEVRADMHTGQQGVEDVLKGIWFDLLLPRPLI